MNRNHAQSLIVLALLASPALAQEGTPPMSAEEKAMMDAYIKAGTPGPEHAALAKTAGTYALKIRSWGKPDAPPAESTGTAVRRMTLGDRVLVEEMSATMMGQPFTGYGMLGYDNTTDEYWTTWNDSMSTGLMVSEGKCDDDGACVFTGSWHDPVTGKEIRSRITTSWTSADTELFEMYAPGPDGREAKMMEITYTRQH
jgi:hypothetical protein